MGILQLSHGTSRGSGLSNLPDGIYCLLVFKSIQIVLYIYIKKPNATANNFYAHLYSEYTAPSLFRCQNESQTRASNYKRSIPIP